MGENMEKYTYKNKELEAEREKYRSDIATLEATEGWSLLTDRQREIIRTTLYLQARAQRDMHPDHKNDPWYYDWFKKANWTPKYQASMAHILNWYCHVAVYALENCDLSAEYPPDCPLEFFDGAYFEVRQYYEITKAIEFFGFPSVVHVSDENGNLSGEDKKYHTFVAMGHGINGEIVVWEKIRQREPYRVTTLKQVHNDYSNILYWGVRKLR